VRLRLVALVLVVLAHAAPVPRLVVGYRFDDHAAPLYDACIFPGEFKSRYGLFLREVARHEQYDLYDGSRPLLFLSLRPGDTDSAVLQALLSGSSDVGILAAEPVMRARLDGKPVRVIAALERRGDMLVVNESVPASDWVGFVKWVKARTRPVVVGYAGRESMTLLGFEQALEYENIRYSRDSLDPKAQVRLVGTKPGPGTELRPGRLDAAVLSEPAATLAGSEPGNRVITSIDTLPPNRFEDRPGTVIAATDSGIRARGPDIGRFLELMGVATHYANNRTHNTLVAATRWLGTSPQFESTAMVHIGYSSMPDRAFRNGLWNWYFALRLKGQVPDSLSGFMDRDEWLGIPYDSSLVGPALDRAGTRIIR